MSDRPGGPRAMLAAMREQVSDCVLADQRALLRAIDRMGRRSRPPQAAEFARLAQRIERSMQRVASRRDSVPPIRYDERLPVHARRAELAATIERSPVTIVSGATGSGKSTQLPKICLEMGRGVHGMIGHTQPRRIAAQALAKRVSEELGTACGGLVGYQVRFVDETGPNTLVKLMTDGLLLRELETDPLLERYDTLIIDEAHERNLNVDFLLGVCRQLVDRRPELRVVVTSATIETGRFAEFFKDAPVVDVEGRSYPVDLRYRPLEDEEGDTPSLSAAVKSALDELAEDRVGGKGDALVFLPGERQIADVRDYLRREGGADWEIFPLFARLSAAEQDRVFAAHSKRRAVLATNVAETSLTIPGIRSVIDSGLARVSRYSLRAKFQRLPIEPVSRASANQRTGRCGREGAGVCIRLYSERDYEERAQYTDPEILRTNLASLILRMAALGLGAPEDFPFLDPPDSRMLNDGYRLLQELSAVDGDRRITRLGRQMAGLPVDPRLARVLVEARRTGCLHEALVIAANLSIRDPRERPAEKTAAADEKHAEFADERSDFQAILNLWESGRVPAKAGRGALRKWCRDHFVSYPRMREWQDLYVQLRDIARTQISRPRNDRRASKPDKSRGTGRQPGDGSAVLHQAILTGFLGGIGMRDEERVYLGARNTRFVIAPGTPLQRRRPRWVVAASLIETERLYARTVAQVQPSWIEAAGAHLVRRSYGEAEWIPERGAVMARETVMLYGHVLGSGRRVNYAGIDPALAHRVFVEEALVARRSRLESAFLETNDATRAAIDRIESKLRRRDLLAMDDALSDFYLERIPGHIAGTRAFERWWRQERKSRPDLLDAPDSVFLARPIPHFAASDFPEHLEVAGNRLPIEYRFDPVSADDGVSIDVPAVLLRELSIDRLSWLVPGMLGEKVVALMRALPKTIRRALVPIPEAAKRFTDCQANPAESSLYDGLAEFITRETGTVVSAQTLGRVDLPPHLKVNVRVHDEAGRLLGSGRDLRNLRRKLRRVIDDQPRAAGTSEWEREGVRRWDFGDLPAAIPFSAGGVRTRMFPGLEDAGSSVSLRLFRSKAAADLATARGLVRLAALALSQQWEMVRKVVAADHALSLLVAFSGGNNEVFRDIADRAVGNAVLGQAGELPRTESAFSRLLDRGRAEVVPEGERVARIVQDTLRALKEAHGFLETRSLSGYPEGVQAVRNQLDRLLRQGWIHSTPDPWFERMPVYVRGVARRLQRMVDDRSRDRGLESMVAPYQHALESLQMEGGRERPSPELSRLRWMIEEFRISLFAQNLRTLIPVSAKRLDAQLARARKEHADS